MLEGFDFGVGMLLPFLPRDERERSTMFRTIGPVWDGNEVWLVVAGGATFAAFPAWYATMFSGFYIALLLLLVLPDRARALVRVARAAARARAGEALWTVGEHDRQLRRAADLGRRALEPALRRADQLERRLRRQLLGPVQPLHACSAGSPSCCCSRSTARPSSRCARPASCAGARAAAAGRLSIAAAVVGAAFLIWTVAVAVDRNDKDVFPPVLPALLAIAALARRGRLSSGSAAAAGRSC